MTVHPITGTTFISDYDENTIYYMNSTSENLEVLLNELPSPTGLTIDPLYNILYVILYDSCESKGIWLTSSMYLQSFIAVGVSGYCGFNGDNDFDAEKNHLNSYQLWSKWNLYFIVK
jgi:hypothetical protein